MSSSATTALSRRPLREVLEGVADPGDRRGVRHALPAVLCLAVTGILAGCRSLTAIWEHVADLAPADLGALGLEEGRALPSESTIRRVLKDLDPAGLDARLTSWFFTRTGAIAGRRVIAVDGKTMRGARTGDNPAPHLLAAPGRASGVVVGQRRVSDKSNEIPALRDLLAPMDLGGVLITADAMHTRRGTAEWIRSRGAHYLLTVKGMPAGPETGAGGPALEGRPGRLERRHRPRAAGAAHRPGRRGPRVDRLPRRRPGGADPPHHNHREAREHGRERQGQEEDHRGGPPGSAPFPWTRPGPRPSPPGPEAIGP